MVKISWIFVAFLENTNFNQVFLTRWIIDKLQMIWILINEPFDEINLLKSYLDGIFVLWTTWSIGNPQLKYKKNKKLGKGQVT